MNLQASSFCGFPGRKKWILQSLRGKPAERHATHPSKTESTNGKENMEPNNGCLEDDFPFQLGDFLGSMF